MTMMPFIFFMLIIASMVSAGMMALGPALQRGMTTDTTASLNKQAEVIFSWSASNNRIPDSTATATGFASVIGTTTDAWSRPLVFAYDANLTSPANGGVCGRTSTSITQNASNVAFVIISGGVDGQINSTPGVSGAYAGNLNALSAADQSRIVTLEELKNRVGCYGSTQGKLKILNNELPKAKTKAAYAATLYADGGVVGTGYVWSLPIKPTWLSINPASGVFSKLSSAAGTYPVQVQITDHQTPSPNIVLRDYSLTVN
jgi:hypothetical protein